jgi:hypothetical protein
MADPTAHEALRYALMAVVLTCINSIALLVVIMS